MESQPNLRRATLAIVAAALVYWPFALVLKRTHLFDMVNAMTITVGIALLTSFCASLWRERSIGTVRALMLLSGIAITWMGITSRTVWNWAWRWSDYPVWMQTHQVTGFMIWLLCVGGMLHLLATSRVVVTYEDRPGRSALQLAAVILTGVMLGVVFILTLE